MLITRRSRLSRSSSPACDAKVPGWRSAVLSRKRPSASGGWSPASGRRRRILFSDASRACRTNSDPRSSASGASPSNVWMLRLAPPPRGSPRTRPPSSPSRAARRGSTTSRRSASICACPTPSTAPWPAWPRASWRPASPRASSPSATWPWRRASWPWARRPSSGSSSAPL